MKIINIIKKDSSKYGLTIDDSGEVYPILMQGLHNPIILDTLLASGWQLYGLPFDIRKDGIKLEELVPSIDYTDANITEQDIQEMLDGAAIVYTEVDLKAKLVKIERETLEWERGDYIINTREDLLMFLDKFQKGDIQLLIPSLYMPLNYFTNPRALFSPEEYFSRDNKRYRRIIEDRRVVSFRQYNKLIEEFLKRGMTNNYTITDVLEKYFSWGLCGVNMRVYEINKTIESLMWGQSSKYVTDEDLLPHMKEFRLTYIDTSGRIFREGDLEDSAWVSRDTDLTLNKKREMAMDKGYDHITPVYLERKTTGYVQHYIGNALNFSFDKDTLLIDFNGKRYSSIPLQIESPLSKLNKLPHHLCNITSEKGKREILEWLYIKMLAKKLIDMTKTDVNVSSFKALQASGCNVLSGLNYIFNEYDVMQNVLEKINEQKGEGTKKGRKQIEIQQLRISVDAYVQGTLTADNPYYEEIQSVVDEFINGYFNIDQTSYGMQLDNQIDIKMYEEFIIVAHRYLHIPLNDIYDKIMTLDGSTSDIELSNEGKRIRVDIEMRDNMLKGYKVDIKDYRVKFADQAQQWLFVLNIYRELGSKEDNKHVAVDGYFFDRTASHNKRFEAWITEKLINAIESNIKYSEQEQHKKLIPVIIARKVFETALTRKLKIPKTMGGGEILLSCSEHAKFGKVLTPFVEGLLSITNTNISEDGKIFRYCSNANIFPERVIPHKNIVMLEKPFAPMWVNTVGYDSLRNRWREQGVLPNDSHLGYSSVYSKQALCTYGRKIENDKWSLAYYFKRAGEWKNDFDLKEKFRAPIHPNEFTFPCLTSEEEITFVDRPATKQGNHKFYVGEGRVVDYNSLLKELPEYDEIFNPVYTTDTLQLTGTSVKPFQWYDADKLSTINDFQDLDTTFEFKNKKRAVVVVNSDRIIFEDDTSKIVSADDIQRLSEMKYAVKHLYGRRYVIMDIKGKLWEVTV